MKPYEKSLKKLLTLSNGGCDPVLCVPENISERDARFLAAKDLIELEPAGDDEFWAIIEPAGLTYFEDKKEEWRKSVTSTAIKYILVFASGVLATIVANYLSSRFL